MISQPIQTITQFFFRFRCPTRLSFGSWSDHQLPKPKGGSFNYLGDKTKIVVFDHNIQTKQAQTHFGIGFDAIIEHSDVDKAKEVVESIVYDLISIFSFSEACYIGKPEFVLRYRVPNYGTELGDVMAYVLDSNYRPIETSIQTINQDRLISIFSGINSITNENRRQMIKNSLHWFWKALYSDDIRDRFLDIWNSIEHLETELKDFYGLKSSGIHYPVCRTCKAEFTTCPSCKKDFGYKASLGFIGYKRLENEVGIDKGLFDKLHEIRSKMVHGKAFSVKLDEVAYAVSQSYRLLTKAIFILSGIEHKLSEKLPKEMHGKSLPLILYFLGNVYVNKFLTLNDVESQPFVEGEYQYEFIVDNKTGDLISNVDVRHDFKGAFSGGQVSKHLLVDKSHKVPQIWER